MLKYAVLLFPFLFLISVSVQAVATCESGGLNEGSCSATKPKYCSAQDTLIDKCETCGCPSGQFCPGGGGGCYADNPPSVSLYTTPSTQQTLGSSFSFSAYLGDDTGFASASWSGSGQSGTIPVDYNSCNAIGSCSFTATITPLNTGTHTITVSVTDKSGKTTTNSISINIVAAGTSPSASPSTSPTSSTCNGPGQYIDPPTGRCITQTECPSGQSWDYDVDGCKAASTASPTLSSGSCPSGSVYDVADSGEGYCRNGNVCGPLNSKNTSGFSLSQCLKDASPTYSAAPTSSSPSSCGAGLCGPGETYENCPQDCPNPGQVGK